MVMAALRWSSILECIMGLVSCLPWTNSAYVYIAWIWHVLLRYGVVINLSLSSAVQYTTMAMTALCWSSLLKCVWWMSCWPWTNSAYVCVTGCMHAQIGMYYWCSDVDRCSIYHDVVISSILLSTYTAYCRVGPDWTKREYVCIDFCLNLTRVIAVRCSMRS